MSEQQGTPWMTVEQVAAYLQVTEETVRRWIRAGELEVLGIGGRRGGYRVHRESLDKFIEERYGPLGKIVAA